MQSPVQVRPFGWRLGVLLTLWSLAVSVPAADVTEKFVGLCIGISDGDTMEVLRKGQPVKVRLEGIDAPEHRQAFASRAKQHLASLSFQKIVHVESSGTDRWGRYIARVTVGPTDLSEAMVGAGLAWHYKRYSSDDRLAQLESRAKSAKIGIWVASHPVAPWDFRSLKYPWREPIAEGNNSYRGNTRSHVFHRSSCEYYRCKNCTRFFPSREDAIASGFRPCGVCHP